MNYDEFAFFNQQLASMLREGIPLEGALRQLSAGMRSGKLQGEIQALEVDLAEGVPLKDALEKRELPELYRRMVDAGARSNDLPGMLTLLADHYHRSNMLWTRLKGLLVYPALVMIVSLGVTWVISAVFGRFLSTLFTQLAVPSVALMIMWVPPLALATTILLGIGALTWPASRRRLRWRLPAFREASLAQLASALALMLRNGTTLAEALALAQQLEGGSPAAKALAVWRQNVEVGKGKPVQWTAATPFPPLFVWLVQKGGEDAAAGFENAADIYRERASYRTELALYGALPVSVLFLGLMILVQVAPLIQSIANMMKMLGDMGG